MIMVQLALYKGPANGLMNRVAAFAIRAWTWSRWSHAELVINGVCWSSSARDGGVRCKRIDLDSGHWDVLDLHLKHEQVTAALAWYQEHQGAAYDYLGIARFVAPFIGHGRTRWECFESVGASLGLAAPHKLTANDLHAWALHRQPDTAAL